MAVTKFSPIISNLIRTIPPIDFTKWLSVQPMTGPVGRVFNIKHAYAKIIIYTGPLYNKIGEILRSVEKISLCHYGDMPYEVENCSLYLIGYDSETNMVAYQGIIGIEITSVYIKLDDLTNAAGNVGFNIPIL